MSNTQICEVCRSTNFEIIDGNFFCTQCFTQNDNIQENVRETRIDPTTRIKSIGRIKTKKADKPIEGWTSWELYNFVIYGLTNEAIELGAPSTIKLTVLQLWTAYLRKLEVAFTSKRKKNVPKLAKIFNKRDAEIIYGKIEQRKKRKRRKGSNSASSAVTSFQSTGSTSYKTSKKTLENSLAEEYEKASSANDSLSSISASQSLVSLQSSFSQGSSHKIRLKFNKGARAEAKKIKVLSSKVSYSRRRKSRKGQVTTRYKLGPQVITPTKLWAILYLALRIHDVNFHLSDMLRYGKEGHLSYYKMDHLIPQEVSLSKQNVTMLTPINELTHKGLRELSAGIANFLNVNFDTPNFLSLVKNYCLELQLPKNLTPSIIVHGGVGESDDSIKMEKMNTCQKAASVGYKILMNGGKASDAAEAALSWFEDDEFFNCGYGSVLNEIGEVQMDASMMDGSKMEIGSVAAISDITHPISLAKYIMENYPNSIIVGEGGEKLAKFAKLNFVSKGSMIAPASFCAYKSAASGDFQVSTFDTAAVSEALKNSSDTVGCVVWDGERIVTAASTGGLNKKLVGRVGDSPLLGCGVFANNHIGCCVTGHGESAIKAGLSRSIINSISQCQNLSDALEINLDDLRKQTTYDCGAVALEKCGSWSIYFTGTTMPYAHIRNNLITYGIDKGEQRTKYLSVEEMQASERDVLLSKLFSFGEWQRFIECRKAVLSEVHFPSNVKYNSDAPGNSHLFLRFLGLIQSKRESEQTPVANTVKPIPELLRKGFQACFDTLNENLPPMKEIVIFPPSVTPHHTYIQQLLDDPYNDLPAILKNNFYDTKIGYTTKPDLLEQLANQCDIDLKIIDTNLHFVEKQVSEFNDLLVLSRKNLAEKVLIKDPKTETNFAKSEKLFDYLHRKIDSKVSVNYTKKKYYDIIKSPLHEELESKSDEFNFDQIGSDGKLLIQIIDSDSDHEELNESVSKINLTSNDNIAEKKFRKAYNLSLSKHEEKATYELKNVLSKRRQVDKIYHRNERGRFTKIEEKSIEMNEEPSTSAENELTEDPEIFMLKDFIKNQNISNRCVSFRPYKDYWMYNCLFSRMRLNNFELFEKELPISFRWLLCECADTIEMSELDLYEEVCLVEAYCTHILKSEKEEGNSTNNVNRKYLNSVLQKW